MKRFVQTAATTMFLTAAIASPALALVTGGTDPSTILQNAFTLVTGPIGQSIAVLGFIVMLMSIARIGVVGLLIYVGVVTGVFGSSYIAQQLLGAS